ncbi:Stress responsive A/B Barrel Domain [Noviherbaspirillum humi]|uniref:Stress responsive A/B Barrel Domain n=1 Tax=Noviherbaspirillum humi TaxID=1688639 RepID=A0A239L5M0_9BURK|nr:Dabb family protein [Noviherbaspirillum humi]SNT25600.1 Stress responsive A/B Barrel Domain [Noviherbaspirillum humi]
MESPAVLRHVVLFAFKQEASAEQVNDTVSRFAALPQAMPGIRQFEWGSNVSPEGLNDGFTHCFTLSFASAEDRDAYLTHPAHQAFVARLGECLARSLVIDYWARASA